MSIKCLNDWVLFQPPGNTQAPEMCTGSALRTWPHSPGGQGCWLGVTEVGEGWGYFLPPYRDLSELEGHQGIQWSKFPGMKKCLNWNTFLWAPFLGERNSLGDAVLWWEGLYSKFLITWGKIHVGRTLEIRKYEGTRFAVLGTGSLFVRFMYRGWMGKQFILHMSNGTSN